MDEAAFLARFRRAGSPAAHPGRFAGHAWEDSWEGFARVLARVGGSLADAAQEPRAAVQAAIDLAGGRVVAAPAAGERLTAAGVAGWEPAGSGAPGRFADVQLGILWAELAVAENAALLFTAASLPERSLAFLAERLLVLVSADALVGGMAEGVARAPRHGHHHTWMSGPSKTADIEQTLVIGAHGAKALVVVRW
jgi:L-lactate dehydrogenase complex protein LldG